MVTAAERQWFPLRVVAGELGRPAADEPLYAPRAVGVARSAVYRPADGADGLAAGVGPWLIGTAEPGNLISALDRTRPITQAMARSPGRIAANLDSSEEPYKRRDHRRDSRRSVLAVGLRTGRVDHAAFSGGVLRLTIPTPSDGARHFLSSSKFVRFVAQDVNSVA
jgi:hypothetical protein